MIKVIMIIVFIFVGLIYDWGGVRGHPGPVSSPSTLLLPSHPSLAVSVPVLAPLHPPSCHDPSKSSQNPKLT